MSTLLWVVLPLLIAIGSALMAVYIMQQRMEAQLARERQSLSEARATIEAQRSTLDELHRLRGEEVKRKALDEFLADIRTEERHFIREQKLLFASRKSLVLQERIFFRNIPLSNWVEHEVPLEDGADVESLLKTVAVFAPELMGPVGDAPVKKLKLLR
jgi:cell division protein FtsB